MEQPGKPLVAVALAVAVAAAAATAPAPAPGCRFCCRACLLHCTGWLRSWVGRCGRCCSGSHCQRASSALAWCVHCGGVTRSITASMVAQDHCSVGDHTAAHAAVAAVPVTAIGAATATVDVAMTAWEVKRLIAPMMTQQHHRWWWLRRQLALMRSSSVRSCRHTICNDAGWPALSAMMLAGSPFLPCHVHA